MTQTVKIPLPPSVNNLFFSSTTKRGKQRRVKTDAYEAWQTEAVLRIRQAMKPVERFPVAIMVAVQGGKGCTRSRDIANIEKASTDALVKAGIIPDDSLMYVHLTVQMYSEPTDKKAPAECYLTVTNDQLRVCWAGAA